MLDELATAIRDRQAILFVGAGVSMAIGLPSWRGLIEQMGAELGEAAELFSNPDLSQFTLAEYYRLRQGSIGPLRSWMDRHWTLSDEALLASTVHEIIVRLDAPIIYTTNFDRNLETAFRLRDKPFVKVANARDVARIREGVTQIIKFHGDFDDDQSLVLAESDYFDRLAFDSPLDIKFRADALGKTILFIGYSLSDLNIRLLLYRLWQTWERSGYEKDRPNSYVFMLRPNAIEQAVLEQWGIRVVSEEAPPETALERFLGKLAEAAGVEGVQGCHSQPSEA
jgi:hypothetical protein